VKRVGPTPTGLRVVQHRVVQRSQRRDQMQMKKGGGEDTAPWSAAGSHRTFQAGDNAPHAAVLMPCHTHIACICVSRIGAYGVW
jgi:hypothetical protein